MDDEKGCPNYIREVEFSIFSSPIYLETFNRGSKLPFNHLIEMCKSSHSL